MDQKRFTTVVPADEVIRQYYLKDELQAIEGPTFKLQLKVDVVFSDEVIDGTITLIVDRNNQAPPVFTFEDENDVLKTTARLEPSGQSFSIDIQLPYGTSVIEGATVSVSRDTLQLFLEHVARRDAAA